MNEWIIKNNYTLPLILDIVENIGTNTKLDLWYGYNNVWINEENKWKIVFKTPEGFFESTVMFFDLTNSPVVFQTIMNEILWNLVNTGEVASFIHNMIVEIEEKNRHDKAVEEVIKRLAENSLYIKPEKCKWKVKKVEFLGVSYVKSTHSKDMSLWQWCYHNKIQYKPVFHNGYFFCNTSI